MVGATGSFSLFFLCFLCSFGRASSAVACVPKSNPPPPPPPFYLSPFMGLVATTEREGDEQAYRLCISVRFPWETYHRHQHGWFHVFSLPFFLLYLPQTSLSEFPWNKFKSRYKKTKLLYLFFFHVQRELIIIQGFEKIFVMIF